MDVATGIQVKDMVGSIARIKEPIWGSRSGIADDPWGRGLRDYSRHGGRRSRRGSLEIRGNHARNMRSCHRGATINGSCGVAADPVGNNTDPRRERVQQGTVVG